MNDIPEIAGLHRFPMARRGLMTGGLMTGFVTLATERVEAQVIHTSTEGLDAGETQIPVSDGHLPAYFARPAKGTDFPTILVFEEIFGVTDYIQDVCRRLAKLGYLAVATEYYARIADLSKFTDTPTIFKEVISKKPDAEYMTDADSTVAWAEANKGDGKRLAVTGFCWGGRMTWLYAAHNPHLRAAVAWYGLIDRPQPTTAIQPHTVMDIAGDIHCPLMGLYGGKDPSIPVKVVRAAEAKARAAGRTVDIHIFPNSGHGFHADYRPSYVEADAKAGWALLRGWFKKHGAI